MVSDTSVLAKGMLGAELPDPTTLVIGLPNDTELAALRYEAPRLRVILKYSPTDAIGTRGVKVSLDKPLGQIAGVDYYSDSGREIKVTLSRDQALAAARDFALADVEPTFEAMRYVDTGNGGGITYYFDFFDGDNLNRAGTAAIRGQVEVSAADGRPVRSVFNGTCFPGARLLSEAEKAGLSQLPQAAKGLEMNGRRLNFSYTEGEFGKVLSGLQAVDTDGATYLVWDARQQTYEPYGNPETVAGGLATDVGLGDVLWSPDGSETYFSTATVGPHYGDWATHAQVWRYSWQSHTLELITFARNTSFALPPGQGKLFTDGQVIDLSEWQKAVTNLTGSVAIYNRPNGDEMGNLSIDRGVMLLKWDSSWAYVQRDGERGWVEVGAVAPPSVVKAYFPGD
jgi:hypothetical protein